MEAWAEFILATADGSRLGNLIHAGHSKILQGNKKYMWAVVLSLCYTVCNVHSLTYAQVKPRFG